MFHNRTPSVAWLGFIAGAVLMSNAAAGSAAAFNFTTLAGNAGYGSADGTNSTARFNFPQGVAVDTAENVYVADTDNSCIRKISPAGIVTTLSGVPGVAGSNDSASGSAAKFKNPEGIAVDSTGNLYIADTRNSIIRKISPLGIVTTIAGSTGFLGVADGTNAVARFRFPGAVASDDAGTLYVADSFNHTIRTLTLVDTNWVVTTIAGLGNTFGNVDGTNTTARFNQPAGICVDSNYNIFVADTGNGAIRKITPSGSNWVTTTLITNLLTRGIAVDGTGNLLVTDSLQNTVRKITRSGTNWSLTVFAGAVGEPGTSDGSTTNAQFNYPSGVAWSTNGFLYVADALNNTIRKITTTGNVSTLAGAAGGAGSADGQTLAARFAGPLGVAVDNLKNVYVADSINHAIREISASGIVTTLAGLTNSQPGSEDGWGTGTNAAASFNRPAAVIMDSHTNLYVADLNNNLIRKMTLVTNRWLVTTLAGRAGTVYYGSVTNIVGGVTNVTAALSSTSTYKNYSGIVTNVIGGVTNIAIVITNFPTVVSVNGSATNTVTLTTNIFSLPVAPHQLDGIGTNALFHHPSGLAMDAAENLYVADGETNGVRVIAPDGTVSTLPGSRGAYAVATNIVGTNQLFYRSTGVAVDSDGNVFVCDSINSMIRKIAPGGVVVTIAGSPGFYGSVDGTNGAARFASPVTLALDSQTNLFVVDAFSHTIRMVSPVGTNWVTTTVGGLAGVSGSEDGDGSAARFNAPGGIATDFLGNLYVADTDNHTIRFGLRTGDFGPVTLQIARIGRQVVLTWSAAAIGYSLESNSSLANGWQTVTNTPAVSGSNLVVTNDISPASAFFRLHK